MYVERVPEQFDGMCILSNIVLKIIKKYILAKVYLEASRGCK